MKNPKRAPKPQWGGKITPPPLTFTLPILKLKSPQMGFLLFSRTTSWTNKPTVVVVFSWRIYTINSHNKTKKSSPPSTHLPCNGYDTLIIKQKNVMLYKIILVLFLVFVLFCSFYVKCFILKSLTISSSISGFRIHHLQEYFLSLR